MQLFAFLLHWLINWLIIPLAGQLVGVFCSPLMLLSLLLLKKGKNHAATTTLIIAYHIGLLICSFDNVSIGALIATGLMPGVSFLITTSSRIHTLNFSLCCIQGLISILKTNMTFGIVLTGDQEVQILSAQVLGALVFATHWMHNYLNKHMETQLFQHVTINYEKTGKITQELVEALSAKDNFISCLSHEIRNPLNSLNGSVSYLLTIVKDPDYLDVLNNAKLSGEILLNLVSNLLDAAKLKSEKMEIENFEANPVDILRNVLIINTENLKKSQIHVQVILSQGIPPQVWIDPNRFLQILMNLMSNAIKFTNEEEGEIKVYMKWYSPTTSEMILKHPIETKPFGTNLQEGEKIQNDTSSRINNQERPSLPSSSNIQEELSKELSSEQAEGHQRKFKYLTKFRARNLSQLISSKRVGDGLVPWTILQKDHLNLNTSIYTNENMTKDNRLPTNPRTNNGILKVQVSDNGCGMSNETLSRLFGMFNQSHNTVANRHGGTGLGLWISKQLCQKMGGDIVVYSKEKKGTTFVLYIPVEIGSAPANPQRCLRSSQQVRVLVVDDQIFNRNLHKLIIEREGAHVTLACDGNEAVEIYKKSPSRHFDLIMMDIQMPVMDGFSATIKIREFEKNNRREHVDIYFVSGEYCDERRMTNELVSRGGEPRTPQVQFLKKPVDLGMIRRIIETCKG